LKQSIKKHMNYVMAVILLVIFSANAISSFILWFILPRGEGRHGTDYSAYGDDLCSAWGLGYPGNNVWVFTWPRYMWVDIHAWICVVAAVLIIIHLVLHWKWIIESTKRVIDNFKKGLKKITEIYITSLILFILLIFQILSGCVHWFVLPRGARDFFYMQGGTGRTFLGLQRNEWSDLHGWIAVIMASIIIIHIILNWRWIVSMTMGKARVLRRRKETIQYQTDLGLSTTISKKRPIYLTRVGIFIGLIGAISFLVLITLHQLDHSGSYASMLWLIPLPIIILLGSGKSSFFSGLSLLALGCFSITLNIYFPIGTPGYIPGLQLGYTIIFVTLPLMISGIIFIFSSRAMQRLNHSIGN